MRAQGLLHARAGAACTRARLRGDKGAAAAEGLEELPPNGGGASCRGRGGRRAGAAAALVAAATDAAAAAAAAETALRRRAAREGAVVGARRRAVQGGGRRPVPPRLAAEAQRAAQPVGAACRDQQARQAQAAVEHPARGGGEGALVITRRAPPRGRPPRGSARGNPPAAARAHARAGDVFGAPKLLPPRLLGMSGM